MQKQPITLGIIQETLLIPLRARAVETFKPDPIVQDPKSVQIIEQLDYDFSVVDRGKGSQIGCCMRGQIFDRWVRDFLDKNPAGTVIDIGSGLNTRFERLDNGQVRWFDLDLPDVTELRQHFFQETERRKLVAASALNPSWVEIIKADPHTPAFFVAEAVLIYLSEDQVRQVFSLLSKNFPGSLFAFDSMSPFMIKNQKRHDVMDKFEARFQWALADPSSLTQWDPSYRLLETKRFADMPIKYRRRMGLLNLLITSVPPFHDMYRLHLMRLG